jgi:hypothetical protein
VAADTVPLSEFEPLLAHAVVSVLQRAGVPASLAMGDASRDEAVVLVPAERREEAFAVLAGSMDAVHEELRARVPRAAAPRPEVAAAPGDDDEVGRPLLFERLRSLGFLPVLLIPLLVVTLAQVRLPAAVTAAIVIAGMVLLTAWRNGRRARTGDDDG